MKSLDRQHFLPASNSINKLLPKLFRNTHKIESSYRKIMLLHFILCLFTFPSTMALGTVQGSNSSSMNNIAKPFCQTHCGNITVPYPFGIGEGTNCSLDDSFYLNCNTSFNPPKLYLKSVFNESRSEIFNISDSELRIFTSVASRCYDGYGNVTHDYGFFNGLGAFTFSQKNKFTVIGCDDIGVITDRQTMKAGKRRPGYVIINEFSSGCLGFCPDVSYVAAGECSGNGCCQISITKVIKYYRIMFRTLQSHKDVWTLNDCGYAFLGDVNTFRFGGVSDLSNSSDLIKRVESSVHVVIDWAIGYPDRNCSQVTECKDNSKCYDIDGGGYRCRCNQGYEGNPYLDQGCQDINECDDKSKCYGHCINTNGSFNCTCWSGYTGNATTPDGCRPIDKGFPVMIFTLALVVGVLAILSGVAGIFFGVRKRKLIKLREKFFEQNGGVFLKQKLNAPGTSEAVILFSSEELRKATDNYSKERIIGHGGYGVVYKGILPDNCVVAIKKSKVVDGTQTEQFINEVLILTQVIHRNVVKLLGCCLEEEVPVLVYEFISNNTLFYHIHRKPCGISCLSWENRLRIASEAAGALGYLHSQATMPIIHRDVKSTNILLDDNYTAKISDFGASRLIPLDHDQVTTLVQGTIGYLDPEYFNTSQLTDKSDVYSFGVVLAELITGQKPLCADRSNEEKNLATYFVKAMKENRLFEIIEPQVLQEGTPEQLQAIADLAKRCLILLGNDRPTMKEVEMELEGMKKFKTHPRGQQQTNEESRSLIMEVEQSDLNDVPSIPSSTNEWESYSGSSTSMMFIESKPR